MNPSILDTDMTALKKTKTSPQRRKGREEI